MREFLSRHKDGLVLLLIVTTSIISIGISTNSVQFRPKELGRSLFGVLQQSVAAVGDFFSNTVTSVGELSELRRQYNSLAEQMREAEATSDQIAMLQQENAQLRAALDFARASEFSNIPARIIGREPGSFFTSITINKGSRHGVGRNMPVVAIQDGTRGLVGRVIEVGLTTSTVMPLVDADSFVAARLTRSRHEGLVAGQGQDGLLLMNYVPKSARAAIGVGDIVITSGMESLFPEGIRIGTVEAIEGRSYETSLELQLSPAIDYSRTEYVFVVETSL
jgi:rod shape-determining protein MreC